jgi:hypothetical protein
MKSTPDMGTLCANLAWVLACLPSWLRFHLALHFPRWTQERRLRALLRRHRATDFGRRHGFAGLGNAAEFAARVPLAEYSDFEAAIAALRRGEPSPFCADPALLLEPTSGSSGAAKLIPYTAALRREFQAAIQPWLAALYLARPRLLCGRHYWSISPNTLPAATESTDPAAVPVGFADDAEYLGPVQRRLAHWLFAAPPEMRHVTDPAAFTHLTLLFLLRERNLRLISVWHPSFLTLLLDALPAHLPTLLCELRSGRLDAGLLLPPHLRQRLQTAFHAAPARAAEVAAWAAASPEAVGRLWPRLQVISCWTDGQTAPWVERLRRGFPGVLLQGKGLLATEGVVTIPTGHGEASVCALRSHFYEFLEPETGTLRRLWELQQGHDYSVVLTTGGGLWRYRLHDLVRVSGTCGRTPCLTFLGKDNAVVDLVGEKLHEQHVATALRAAADATGIRPAFALLAPRIAEGGCRYLLFLELPDAAADAAARFAAAVEAELCRNYHYAHARRLGQLAAVEPYRVGGNAMAAYRETLVAGGIKAGDIKLPALRGESFWPEVFTRQSSGVISTPAVGPGGKTATRGGGTRRRAALCAWLCVLLPGLLPTTALGANPLDHTVRVTAAVQASPAQITLNWPTIAGATDITIYRKSLTSSTWGSVRETLAASATTYADSGVTLGAGYEYRVAATQNGVAANGYLYAGIDLPLVDSRGKVILLVDTTLATPLAAELARLEYDLRGDGWTVLRHDVARQATTAAAATAAEVAAIKSVIAADYNADPTNVKTLLLIGRVPLPYSGAINPDGHEEHLGAWPADLYYSLVGTTWTDLLALSTNGRNANQAGDGKYDYSLYASSQVKLAVGRVDLSALPAFGVTETELLRRYLNKNHAFRKRQQAYQSRCVVDDNFGEFGGEAFAQNGWRIATLTGVAHTVAGDFFSDSTPSLWAYGCGAGSYAGCSGVGSTAAFVSGVPKGVFTMLFGSYFGDYDSQDNLMRACLASQGAGLTCVWAGRPNWAFHSMALGEPIGTSVRLNWANPTLRPDSGEAAGWVHAGFLGDPTLRLHILAPPTELTCTAGTLSWTPSADAASAGFQGYHVYRAATAAGPFSRRTSSVLTGTSWTPAAQDNPAVYQVRAIRLETSTTGTYYNNSRGEFISVSDSGQGNRTPSAADQEVATDEDSAKAITLGSTDADADPLSYSIVIAPRHGVLSGTSPNLTYRPAANYNGPDSFAFSASDGQAESRVATITLTVIPVNDRPTVSAIANASIDEDTALGNLLFTVGDVETAADHLILAVATSNQGLLPDSGIMLGGSGASRTLSLTPAANHFGSVTVTLTVSDGEGAGTQRAFVLTVRSVNDLPSLSSLPDQFTDEDTAVTALALTVADLETPAGSLLLNGTSSNPLLLPAAGITFGGSGAERTVSLHPAAQQSGSASVTVTVTDGDGGRATSSFTLTVTAVDDAPVAANDSYALAEDTTLTSAAPGVLGNDDDIEGSALTVLVATAPSHGALSLNTDGSFTYSPAPNWNGSDNFSYTANDGALNSPPAIVSLTVTAVNDPPRNTAAPTVSGKHLLTVQAGTWDDATDQTPGMPLRYAYQWRRAAAADGTGAADIPEASGPTYAVRAADVGQYLCVRVTAADAGEGTPPSRSTSVATAWALVTNAAPAIVQGESVTQTMDEDGIPSAWVAPAVSATDADDDTLTWSILEGPYHGALTVNGSGEAPTTFTYAPAANWNGREAFTLQVSDAFGGVDSVAVTVTVSAVNDPPENLVPPSVHGDLLFDAVLSADSGEWSDARDGSPGVITFAYLWQRAESDTGTNAVDIPGAPGASYRVIAADVGTYLRVRVTATDSGTPGMATAAATSAWVYLTKAGQTLAFDPLPAKTYGDADFAAGATATSNLAVHYESSDPAVATVAGNTLHIVGTGATTITASQAGDANWEPAPGESRTLTVGPATLTCTAADTERAYGEANPAFTIVYAGFVNGDDEGDLDTAPVTSCAATPASPAGTYTITLEGGSAPNYRLALVSGILTLYDRLAPVVESIRRLLPVGQDTNAAKVTFAVTFSEPVVGLDCASFAVDGSGAQQTGAVVLDVTRTQPGWKLTGADDRWTVRVLTAAGEGRLSLDLLHGLTQITDSGGNSVPDAFTAGEDYHVDRTAPTITAFSPATAASGFPLADALALTFDEPVFAGIGHVTIRRGADGSVFEAIPVSGPGGTVIAGNRVTIPHAGLVAGSEYYVLMDPGGFVDATGNPCAGLSGSAVWRFRARQWEVTLAAGPGGSLVGALLQKVDAGGSTTPVAAVPDFGYVFERWSDGSSQNPWTEPRVVADMTVSARFLEAGPVVPDGQFLARVTPADVLAGRGLWDVTGQCTAHVGANPLTLNLVHDTKGRLSGVGVCTLAGAVPVDVPLVVRGNCRGTGSARVATLSLEGANAAGGASVSLTLRLSLDMNTRQFSGPVTGSLRSSAGTTRVAESLTLTLDPAAQMDGTWTLHFTLDAARRGISGTALLTLSNGTAYLATVAGRAIGTTAVLSLSADPGDPAAKAIKIRTTITPMEGGWARLESLSGRGYGQTLGW